MKINIDNCHISGKASLLNDAQVIGNPMDITIQNTKIMDEASVLSDLDIHEFVQAARTIVNSMDETNPEYESIKRIANTKPEDKQKLLGKIAEHLANFTTGVLANVVSAMLMK